MPDTTPGDQPKPRKTRAKPAQRTQEPTSGPGQPQTPPKETNGSHAATSERMAAAMESSIEVPRNLNFRDKHNAKLAAGHRVKVDPKPSVDVVDPRDPFAEVPKYMPGQLPPVLEQFITDCVASWGGDPGAYACTILSVISGVLHASVKMNTNPDKPSVLRNPNDHSLTLARSGDNKSGMLRDLMRRQEKWHADAAKARVGTTTKRAKGDMGARVMLQRASTEGALAQITDNRGDRLIMTTEEAMGLLKGAGAHRGAGAADAINDLMIATYDGGVFSKRLVGKLWDIPECLGTFTMVGIFDEMADWEGFPLAIRSGALARTTVGLIAHPQLRDRASAVEGAEGRMNDLLDKLHALRNVHFRLSEAAALRWFGFTATKEAKNRELVERGESDGLVAWARKYDMRIMSMATMFQAVEFIAGNGVDCVESVIEEAVPEGVKVEDVRKLRTVQISEANLVAAAKFVEGYLFDVQRVFYERAAGVTEFHMELLNFIAYRVTSDDPDKPEGRVIPRNDLTYNGPRCMRGSVTDARKAQHNRWIRTLIDHGFIEVHEHPNQRRLKAMRKDEEERWFRLRDEFFVKFKEAREWARDHYEKSRLGNAAAGSGPATGAEI